MSAAAWWWLSAGVYLVVAIGVTRAVYSNDYVTEVKNLKAKTGSTKRPSSAGVHHERVPLVMYGIAGVLWPIWVPLMAATFALGPVLKIVGKWWFHSVERKLSKEGM